MFFAYQFAEIMHRPDVEVFLSELTSTQLLRWQAYYVVKKAKEKEAYAEAQQNR